LHHVRDCQAENFVISEIKCLKMAQMSGKKHANEKRFSIKSPRILSLPIEN